MPAGEQEPSPVDTRREWLMSSLARVRAGSARARVHDAAVVLSTVTGDAVSVRALSPDGSLLVPLAAEHPDAKLAGEMLATMRRSEQPADSGFWLPVVTTGRPHRWRIDGAVPDEASAVQADFMARYPLRSLLGVPVTHHAELVGGLALIRLFDDRPLTDADESLVLVCAEYLGSAVAACREDGDA